MQCLPASVAGHGHERHQTVAVHRQELAAGRYAVQIDPAEGMPVGQQRPACDSAQAATAAAGLEIARRWSNALLDAVVGAAVEATCRVDIMLHGCSRERPANARYLPGMA